MKLFIMMADEMVNFIMAWGHGPGMAHDDRASLLTRITDTVIRDVRINFSHYDCDIQ